MSQRKIRSTPWRSTCKFGKEGKWNGCLSFLNPFPTVQFTRGYVSLRSTFLRIRYYFLYYGQQQGSKKKVMISCAKLWGLLLQRILTWLESGSISTEFIGASRDQTESTGNHFSCFRKHWQMNLEKVSSLKFSLRLFKESPKRISLSLHVPHLKAGPSPAKRMTVKESWLETIIWTLLYMYSIGPAFCVVISRL